MEYVFGFVERNGVTVENLKTIGEAHSDLKGFVTTTREYTDRTITDRFRVLEKYRSDKDAEGNCYDWYVIADHYRYEDKFTPVSASLKQTDDMMLAKNAALAESQQFLEDCIAEMAEVVYA